MGVTITFNHFPALLARLEQDVPKILDEYAVKVREEAQREMPRRTGSAADGLYAVTPLRNEYAQAASKAKSDNPDVEIVPQVDVPSGGIAIAGAAAHTAAVELGSVNMAPRPSLVPALEHHKADILDALAKVLDHD